MHIAASFKQLFNKNKFKQSSFIYFFCFLMVHTQEGALQRILVQSSSIVAAHLSGVGEI